MKVDVGKKRAGRPFDCLELKELLKYIVSPERKEFISIYGVYGHSGHSYNTSSKNESRNYFLEELKRVNFAAKTALDLAPELSLTILVGATPTAHFSRNIPNGDSLQSLLGEALAGDLELHAGNYTFCDLQQVATGLVDESDTSLFLHAEILATYEKRNDFFPGELLIDAGAIALDREPGPWEG